MPWQVVENRLLSFDRAGTKIRDLMLERLAAVLARLLTFELIEGGRRSSLPSRPAIGRSPGASIPRPCGNDNDEDNGDADDDGDDAAQDDGSDDSTDQFEEEETGRGEEDSENAADSAVENPEKNRVFSGAVPPLAEYDGNGDRKGLAGVDEDASRRGSASVSSADSSANGSGGAGERTPTQVARWLEFRTMDLSSFLGVALLAGDVQAASIAWRRHGRTDRGVGAVRRTGSSAATPAGAGGSRSGGGGGAAGEDEEGRRLEMALPGQLAAVPAGAPPVLLGAWLRDEVLPWLDVAGVMAVSLGGRHFGPGRGERVYSCRAWP